MRDYKAKGVDAYIAASPEESRDTLMSLRKIIKSTVPEAKESISWGVPFYKYHGLLGGFSVFKKHATFGLAFALDEKIRDKLEAKGYKTGSKTVQIRFDQAVPAEEIKQILLAKAKINEHNR
ncbi:MAG: hypothetical protein BWZ03_00326 [bacterium ADurb.BinA186]|nr:MAG: hypothetical protein BWZ03_00326 [bacterium ADurb.BinA186]